MARPIARRARAAASRSLLSLGSDAAIARGGLGVTRIAEMLGREKSQVSRTLKTLADFGLVDRDPDTLAYRLGWRIYALASLAGERRLLDDARPVLRRLVDEFEERAFLSVLQGPDTLTILSESSDYAVQAIGWVGRVTPAYCTSVGQALLLDHDRPSLDRLFRDTEFRRLGPNTARNVKRARPAHRGRARARLRDGRRGARGRARLRRGAGARRRRPHRRGAQRLRAQVPLRRAPGRGGRARSWRPRRSSARPCPGAGVRAAS